MFLAFCREKIVLNIFKPKLFDQRSCCSEESLNKLVKISKKNHEI